MKQGLIKFGIACIAVGLLWAFVGVERVVGDHEMGVSWEPFVKHQPSLQIRFTNPAQKGLELASFDSLSPREQTAFVEFCVIRFGEPDPAKCSTAISNRRI